MSVTPTPGPWRLNVRHTNGEIWAGAHPGNSMLAHILGDGCREVTEANGRLMVAAPDLLATLEWVVAQQLDFIECAHGEEIIRRCKAAIAKAGGRVDVYAE